MGGFFLTEISVAQAATIISLFSTAFFLSKFKHKTKATYWMTSALISYGFFNMAYFWSSSHTQEFAAYHRFLTVCLVFTSITLISQLFLVFPISATKKLRRSFIYFCLLLFIPTSLYFMFSVSSQPDIIFRLHGGQWDFSSDKESMVSISVILVGVGILFATYIFHGRKLFPDKKRIIRKSIIAMGVATLVPASFRLFLSMGIVPVNVFQLSFTIFTMIGMTAMIIIYVNEAEEKSTFMAKIIIITLATVMALFQVFSFSYMRNAGEKFISQLKNERILKNKTGPNIAFTTYNGDSALVHKGSFLQLDNSVLEKSYLNINIFRGLYRAQTGKQWENAIFLAKKLSTIPAWDILRDSGILEQDRITGQANLKKILKVISDAENLLHKYGHIKLKERLPEFIKKSGIPEALANEIRKAGEAKEGRPLRADILALLTANSVTQNWFIRENPNGISHTFTIYFKELHKELETELSIPYLMYRDAMHKEAIFLMILLLIICLILLIFFPIFFRAGLIMPLRALIHGVERIDRGDYEVKVPVKVNDEIGVLTDNFNKMVVGIRDSRDNLEKKVEARTKELSEAFEKLKQLDTLKTNFFANISHELRTPLTLILSPLESLLQGDAGKMQTEHMSMLHSSLKNGQRLLKLVNNLLDFSKLEAGQMKLKYKQVNFVAFVSELASNFNSAAESAGLELKVTSQVPKMSVFLDMEKMEKVILNVLSNAFKFTKAGGIYLHISELEQNGILCACLEIKDTGIGIPEDKYDLIFERFSQVDASASRKYEGTGIGLALVKEFVNLHAGEITVSSALEKGSTFKIIIPKLAPELSQTDQETIGSSADNFVEKKSATRSAVLHEIQDKVSNMTLVEENEEYVLQIDNENVNRSSETILLVEDNHDMRKFVYFLLKRYFQVKTAINGKEGLDKAIKLKPDLILSDVMMPEMDGYTLTKEIRNHDALKSTPIILLTAKADISMMVEGLEHGADDYVVKPFNSRELLARIRAQLRLHALQKQVVVFSEQLKTVNDKLTGQLQTQVSEILKASNFRNYLPPQLVNAVLNRETTAKVESRRKKLTIFFSDIVDFTRISEELEPEELSKLLNSYLSEMTAIAGKYNGTIDKFIGDAILIHFGDWHSEGDEGDASACVQMAIDMQIRMRELAAFWIEQGFSEPLTIRCGINTGFTAVGNFGSEDRLDYTVIGSQVNLASRLQSKAQPGGIIVSHSTWALTQKKFRMEAIENIKVKGFDRLFPVYKVLY